MRWFAEGFAYVVAGATIMLFMWSELRLLTHLFG